MLDEPTTLPHSHNTISTAHILPRHQPSQCIHASYLYIFPNSTLYKIPLTAYPSTYTPKPISVIPPEHKPIVVTAYTRPNSIIILVLTFSLYSQHSSPINGDLVGPTSDI